MKRGQAALEFLSTYAWAVVVILIAIGAMAYFGLWTPEQFLPSKCVVENPFACPDSVVTEDGEILMEIKYLLTGRLFPVSINMSTFSCNLEYSSVDLLETVEANSFLNESGDGLIHFRCTPESTPPVGAKFRAEILITYEQVNTGVEHTITGNLERRVE